jgi:cysteine-rich repeat protein
VQIVAGTACVLVFTECGGRVEYLGGVGGNATAIPSSQSTSTPSGGEPSMGGSSSQPNGGGGVAASSTAGAPTGGSTTGAVIHCPEGKQVAVSGPACGDGQRDSEEQCDDGNAMNGDGCDARCRVEPSWVCAWAGSPCSRCGNCQLETGEQCDDGNTAGGDGCSERCQQESGYVCGRPEQACMPFGECGDGRVGGYHELCDDGNTKGGDGCSADCTQVEPGYVCHAPNIPCERVSVVHPLCGDGVAQFDTGEECDDAINNGRRGWCSADCQVPSCGDGQVQPEWGEECDDGANAGGYAECTQACMFAPRPDNPICSGSIIRASCGDGLWDERFEQCDDGYDNGRNGQCEVDCTIARHGYCGDGAVVAPYEECDDGNLASCDGCSALCQKETRI